MSAQPDQATAETSAGSLRTARAEPRRFSRYAAVAAIACVVIAGSVYLFSRADNTPPPRQVRDLTVVKIVPPPPPPPPQQLPEPKLIEQPKMVEPEIKPLEQPKEDKPAKDAKDDTPPGPLSLDAKAEGPGDLFRLGGHPGGSPFGTGNGSRWGWYASIVQSQIEAALRGNDKTRNAVMAVRIRLWADSVGRVTRVQITPSTGDAVLDAVMRDSVFGALVLREPPPKDMPMPMVLSVTERRPS